MSDDSIKIVDPIDAEEQKRQRRLGILKQVLKAAKLIGLILLGDSLHGKAELGIVLLYIAFLLED